MSLCRKIVWRKMSYDALTAASRPFVRQTSQFSSLRPFVRQTSQFSVSHLSVRQTSCLLSASRPVLRQASQFSSSRSFVLLGVLLFAAVCFGGHLVDERWLAGADEWTRSGNES